MGFRFRQTLQILPGIRLNVGKTGASLSFGVRGAQTTVGRTGTRTTLGIPGTGLSHTSLQGHGEGVPQERKTRSVVVLLAELLFLAALIRVAFSLTH